MPPFRNISEGMGSMLPNEDPNSNYIGTHKCYTCVGVYFLVNEDYCFAAHMGAYNALTCGNHYTTKTAGKEITDRAKARMQEFFQANDWDPTHEKFGQQLTIILPSAKGPTEELHPAGRYVVEGLQDFFHACSNQVTNAAQSIGITNMPERMRLMAKGVSLFARASKMMDEVISNRHGFIANPSQNELVLLGELEQRGYDKERDLGTWTELGDDWKARPQMGKCFFGVQNDSMEQIPAMYWATPEKRQELIAWLQHINTLYPMKRDFLDRLNALVINQ